MPVAQYMEMCLTHPRYGYYVTRESARRWRRLHLLSPEISQMFGELIGLWAASVWRSHGFAEPASTSSGAWSGPRHHDGGHAARGKNPAAAFYEAIGVQFVEGNPVLRERQRDKLADPGKSIVWHKTLEEVSTAPAIYFANEFFDALPIKQAVKQDDGWHHRTVGIAPDGKLQFSFDPRTLAAFEQSLPFSVRGAASGSIFEWRQNYVAIELGRRIARQSAALIIDYGHLKTATRHDTLQADRAHGYDDPLMRTRPGRSHRARGLRSAGGGAGRHVARGLERTLSIKNVSAPPRYRYPCRCAQGQFLAEGNGRHRQRPRTPDIAGKKTCMGRLFKVLAVAQLAIIADAAGI